MQNYKQYFKGKKITVMGLGLLGRGLGYTKFLAECLSCQDKADGAELIVTDLKTKEQLKASIEAIKNYELRIKNKNSKKIKFVLGGHRLQDFKGRDMIIKAAGVPLDSIYLKEAKKNGIPIEMDVSLFAKIAPGVVIVGVTGTRGKSMTTALIYEILKKNEKYLNNPSGKSLSIKTPKVFLGGNMRGVATLPLLRKVEKGDILVCELDSWQLQGFGPTSPRLRRESDSGFSPHISVFTSFMPDHMNYYKDSMQKYFNDKANIFKYQKENDVLIIRPGMKKFINPVRSRPRYQSGATVTLGRLAFNGVKKSDTKGKLIVVNSKDVEDWKFNVLGSHQRENLACAVEVAKQFNIPISKIKKSVADFQGLEGRMQLLRVYKGIKIYNDNNATTPEATIAGLKALSSVRQVLTEKTPQVRPVGKKSGSRTFRNSIILICGGANKNLPLDNLVKMVNNNCKAVILIPGTGTDKFLSSQKLKVESYKAKDLKEAVENSLGLASRGDVILFSPAFASFGMFNNEYERNDLFIKIINKLSTRTVKWDGK